MKKFIFSLVFFAIASVAFAQDIQLGKPGFTAIQVDPAEYQVLLNQTRKSVGAGSLERKEELDQYCYERCLHLAKIFLANPELYCLSYGQGENSIFHKEAHTGYSKMENAFHHLESPKKQIERADEISSGYNSSPGHYNNRINTKWKSFGTCTIVISYYDNGDNNPKIFMHNDYHDPTNPTSRERIVRKLVISYEAFE